mgnify:CR=1 FL=1
MHETTDSLLNFSRIRISFNLKRWFKSIVTIVYEQSFFIHKSISFESNLPKYFPLDSKFNFDGKKSDLVLNMCKDLGANKYIFGAQGANYADTEKFKTSGIEVFFQNYQHPTYNQIHGNFKLNLSIIDLLFNCGKNSLDVIIKNQDNFKLE